MPRLTRGYDLGDMGTVSNMRVFHDFYPGRSGDGMTIDRSRRQMVSTVQSNG